MFAKDVFTTKAYTCRTSRVTATQDPGSDASTAAPPSKGKRNTANTVSVTRVAPQATVKSPPNDPVGPPILQAGQPSQGHWKCPHCSFVEECQEPLTEASFDRIRKHLDQHARRKDCPSVKCPVCAKSFCSAQHSNFGNHQRGHKLTGDYTKLHLDTTGSRDVDAQAPGNEVNDVNEVNEVSFSISISFSIFRPGGFFSRFSLNSRHFKLKKLAKLKDFS